MKHHYEFFEMYKVFHALVKTQHFAIIKCFRCDSAVNKFLELFDLDGTMQQT